MRVLYKNFCLTSLAVASCLSTSACNVFVTEINVYSMCDICHAATSLMDEVFINQEEDPYVIEADGTLDVAALQLQPATVVINGSVITPTSSCRQKLANWY